MPALVNGQALSGQDSLYVSAVTDTYTKEVIIKIVNASTRAQMQNIKLDGVKKMPSQAFITVLSGNDTSSVNSFNQPENIAPKESVITIKKGRLDVTAAPYSFSVIKVKI